MIYLLSTHFLSTPLITYLLLLFAIPYKPKNTLKWPESFFNKVIDPLNIQRLLSISALRILLPRIVIDHQQQYIRKRINAKILSAGELLLFLSLFEVVLVELSHVGVLLLGLEMAAVT